MTDDRFFPMASSVFLLSAIAISGVYRARAARQGGKLPDRPEGAPPIAVRLAIALVVGSLVGLPLINAEFGRWLTVDVPRWIRWVGFVLAGAALPGIWWTVATIGVNISESVSTRHGASLVVRGPYRFVQHPLYSLGFVLLLGIGLMLGSAPLWLGCLGLCWWLPRRVAVEERNLASAFGEAHRDYRRRTGRFYPRLDQLA